MKKYRLILKDRPINLISYSQVICRVVDIGLSEEFKDALRKNHDSYMKVLDKLLNFYGTDWETNSYILVSAPVRINIRKQIIYKSFSKFSLRRDIELAHLSYSPIYESSVPDIGKLLEEIKNDVFVVSNIKVQLTIDILKHDPINDLINANIR